MVLNIATEQNGQDGQLRAIYDAVLRLTSRLHLADRELRLSDSFCVRSEADRTTIKQLASQIQALPESQQQSLPALVNASGVLLAASGELEEAQHAFQQVGRLVSNPQAQAEASANAYLVALERRQWDEALTLLKDAAVKDGDRFAPFPLDRFHPERILRASASSVDFLCQDSVSKIPVLVQSLPMDCLEQEAESILRQIEVLSHIDHPGILRPLEWGFAGKEKTRPYLVMDYVEAPTLEEQIESHSPMDPSTFHPFARLLAETLQAAHSQGILHGDLRPAHILVRSDSGNWQAKLFYFGLNLKQTVIQAVASHLPKRKHTILGATVANLLAFAAPEQVGWLENVAIGPYSDIYGFGKTCYFGLLGTSDPDNEKKETLSMALRKLLGSCTARTVARRPVDFHSVIKRLSRLPAEAPPMARTAEPPDPVDAFNRGVVNLNQARYNRAIADFTEAIQLEPANVMAMINRGEAYRLKSDYDSAIADFTEAIRLDPQNALAFNNRGIAHRSKGR